MTLHAPRSSDPPAGGHRELWVRGLVRLALLGPFVGALLFGAAGTLAWSRGWVFIALLLLTLGANLTLMLRRNPELVRERWKRREDTKPFDKVFGVFYLLSLPALFVVAGLDAGRFGWTTMPSELLWVGIALHVLGLVPILAALLFNPHLETTVRIQKDRDHQVVTDGPYRVVRHPMYVGIIVMFAGWPLVLGSWAAMGVVAALAALFVIRTALEDRTLRAELPGYEAYTKQTRYRLLPGVW
jgi:protein-S-isoprenylcysteine O-methyltransferase Ste14